MAGVDTLMHRFSDEADPAAMAWLLESIIAVRANDPAIHERFPKVSEHVPATGLKADPDWQLDEVARAILLRACGDALPAALPTLYQQGGAAERCAILRAVPLLPLPHREPRAVTSSPDPATA